MSASHAGDVEHVCDLTAADLDEHLWLIDGIRGTEDDTILDTLAEASNGIRADCEWWPNPADVLSDLSMSIVMCQILASRAMLALADGNIAWRGLLRLHGGFSTPLRSALDNGTGLHEDILFDYQPPYPLDQDPLTMALGTPPLTLEQSLRAAAKAFDAAHALASEYLYLRLAQFPDDGDLHAGLHVAGMLIQSVRMAPLRPAELPADKSSDDHPDVAAHGMQLRLLRRYMVLLGRGLMHWAIETAAGRTRGVALDCATYLITGRTLSGEAERDDIDALSVVAERVALLGGDLQLYLPPEDAEWLLDFVVEQLVAHFRAGRGIDIPPFWRGPRRILVPPPPDLHIGHLNHHAKTMPPTAEAYLRGAFQRAEDLASDALSGVRVFTGDADTRRALEFAAATVSRRARAASAPESGYLRPAVLHALHELS